MILQSLSLENIRSYVNMDTPVQFPLGITLFQGDMHSGKSTLLYAIEFVLFGLGEFRGSFLLRNGSNRGSVTLCFEEGGKKYEVQRCLIRKGKTIQQEECYLKGPSGKQILAPTDLKEKILQILGFNESPNPRAQSVVYRYAIFTPQEEMKEIVKKDAEARLQTLRKAFRIEDYKTAIQNCEILSSLLGKKIIYLKGVTQDIGKDKASLNEANNKATRIQDELNPLEMREADFQKQKNSSEKRYLQLDKERERLSKLEDKIPLLDKRIVEKSNDINISSEQIVKLRSKIKTIDSQILDHENFKKPTDLSPEQLKVKKNNIQKQIQEQRENKQKADQAASKFSLMIKRLKQLDNEIKEDTNYLANKESKLEEIKNEISKLKRFRKSTDKNLDQLKEERLDYDKKQNKLNDQKSKLEERISNFSSLINNRKCPICERTANIDDFSTKKSMINTELNKLNALSKLMNKEIKVIDVQIKELENFGQVQKDLKKFSTDEQETKETVQKLTKSIYSRSKEKNELQNDITKTELESKKQKSLQERIDTLEQEKEEIFGLIDSQNKYELAQKSIVRLNLDRIECNNSIDHFTGLIQKQKQESKELEKEKEEALEHIKPIGSIIKELSRLTSTIKKAEYDLKMVRDKISSSKTGLKHYLEIRKSLESEIELKEKKLTKIDILSEYKTWLKDFFSPSVQNIEVHVMEFLRRRFNEHFQKWFQILIDDPAFQVSVDEEFTPVIENNGFNQEYIQLSGGERTSLALAYRLALNTIVQEISTGGTSNLLILDEPTDGFSKEQLIRMRSVLCEIQCPQIIIVSHERELEAFANNIIRIENINGISQMSI